MSKGWAWVVSIVIAACIFGLIAAGRNDRRAYWTARGAVMRQAQQAQATPQPVDWLLRRQPGR